MCGPLSVVFTGCFMNKMEQEIVKPANPRFYKRYVDDAYCRRYKKNETDTMFQSLNSFHPNINLIIEENPKMALLVSEW